MSRPPGIWFKGPLEPYAGGFAAELSQLGYTPSSAKAQLLVMSHLSRWLAARDLDAVALSSAAVVDEFFAARRTAGYTNYRTAKALQPLLGFLRTLGVIGPAVVTERTPVEALLERYRGYLIGERGLTSATARGYMDAVRSFVASCDIDGKLRLGQLTGGEVTAFVLAVCPDQTPGSAKMTVTALRSLLRFLHVDGVLASSLVAAVPSVASWRLAGLPKGLEPDEVGRLLLSCDRRTGTGRRDFAIVLSLVRLGLRAGEVAGLGLDDIDWRAGELVVRGKGDRHERLPLPDDVGEAVVGYLQRGRPATALGRSVFVRVRAPHRRLTTAAVSNVVLSAGKRAGLDAPVRAHRLRHTTCPPSTRRPRSRPPISCPADSDGRRRTCTATTTSRRCSRAPRSCAASCGPRPTGRFSACSP